MQLPGTLGQVPLPDLNPRMHQSRDQKDQKKMCVPRERPALRESKNTIHDDVRGARELFPEMLVPETAPEATDRVRFRHGAEARSVGADRFEMEEDGEHGEDVAEGVDYDGGAEPVEEDGYQTRQG